MKYKFIWRLKPVHTKQKNGSINIVTNVITQDFFIVDNKMAVNTFLEWHKVEQTFIHRQT